MKLTSTLLPLAILALAGVASAQEWVVFSAPCTGANPEPVEQVCPSSDFKGVFFAQYGPANATPSVSGTAPPGATLTLTQQSNGAVFVRLDWPSASIQAVQPGEYFATVNVAVGAASDSCTLKMLVDVPMLTCPTIQQVVTQGKKLEFDVTAKAACSTYKLRIDLDGASPGQFKDTQPACGANSPLTRTWQIVPSQSSALDPGLYNIVFRASQWRQCKRVGKVVECTVELKVLEDPLAVALIDMSATLVPPGVSVDWRTASEPDTVGFRLHRSHVRDGPFLPISSLIASQGGQSFGASYVYFDGPVPRLPRSPWYMLEDIDQFGVSTFHPAVKVDNWPTVRRTPVKKP